MSATAAAEPHDDVQRDAAGLITVVVVHFGEAEPTRRCLDSLAMFPHVILVDQPPTRFGEHPAVSRRIVTDANIGFAAACNRAVAAATTPLVLLLNNDAFLEPDTAQRLLEVVGTLPPDVAGACLKLLSTDGRMIQSVGGLLFTRDGIGFPRGFGEIDRGQYDGLSDDEIGVPSGACALYRTEAWRRAGGMREEFFCYCEDGDLGLRMVSLGYRFVSLPHVVVRHDMSAGSGTHSMFKAFHVERNHFLTMLHVAPAPALAALPVWTLVRLLRLAFDAARGSGAGRGLAGAASPQQLAATLVRAWLGVLPLLRGAVQVRRTLRREQPQADARVAAFLRTRRAPLSHFARSRDA